MKELTDLIAPAFYEVHWKIKEREFVHYWEKGGRGSTKSSFISIEFINELIRDPQKHGIALRKYKDNLRDSVFNQLLWAINELGLNDYFIWTYSPLKITYYTGQTIFFRGCDDPTKIKSIKTDFGYIGIGWFEELNEFSGMEEVRNVSQSFIRGGDDFLVFYSYNPPESKTNWVNEESLLKIAGRNVHHSTYLDVPQEWLGKQFIIEADSLKASKPDKYEHELLGIPNGSNDNTVTRYFTDENIADIEYCPDEPLHLTCDFNKDPMSWILVHKTDNMVFFFDELIIENTDVDQSVDIFIQKYPNHQNKIVLNGDASGDKTNAGDLRSYFKRLYDKLRAYGYKVDVKIKKSNPYKLTRIESWNARILTDTGERCVFVDPKCKWLLYNIYNLKFKSGTSIIDEPTRTMLSNDKKSKFLVHPFDAASYLVDYYWQIQRAKVAKKAA